MTTLHTSLRRHLVRERSSSSSGSSNDQAITTTATATATAISTPAAKTTAPTPPRESRFSPAPSAHNTPPPQSQPSTISQYRWLRPPAASYRRIALTAHLPIHDVGTRPSTIQDETKLVGRGVVSKAPFEELTVISDLTHAQWEPKGGGGGMERARGYKMRDVSDGETCTVGWLLVELLSGVSYGEG